MAVNLSFTLDAGKILAKLHRGAVQAHSDMLWFNTGIIDDENVDPEKVDASKINFDIVEGGNYELGVIINEKTAIKFGQSPEEIVKMYQDYVNNRDNDKGKKEKNRNNNGQQGQQGGNQQQGNQQGNRQGNQQQSGQQNNGGDSSQSINQNPNQQVNEDYTEMDPKTMIDPETLVSLIALSVTGDITPDELAKESSTAPEHVARALKNNRDAVKLFIEQQMEAATEYLKDYMKVFAGEQEANKISVNDVVFTYVPGKFSNPYKNPSYKQHNYQIPAETDETVRKIKLKQLSKNPKAKQYDLQNVCFKIGYSLSGAK